MEKLLLLFLLIPVGLWSQTITIKGQILEDSSGVVIPFSTVAVTGKGVGVATGIDGLFELAIEKYSKSDSLEFSALGYEAHRVLLSDFLKRPTAGAGVDVALTPVAYDLGTVEVFPTKEEETFGTLSDTTIGPAYSFTAGAQVAVFIPNEKGQKGIIKSVSYFFTDKRRKPTAPFRVRIIAADEDGRPGKDFLLTSVVVNAPRADEWFTVNLEKYGLPFPEHGYFAGLELIYTSKKYRYKPRHSPKSLKKQICQGPSLGNTRGNTPSHSWNGRIGGGWGMYHFVYDGYTYNRMIQSTVKYAE